MTVEKPKINWFSMKKRVRKAVYDFLTKLAFTKMSQMIFVKIIGSK